MCKTALVTGAGVGIGKGIALEMARAGYDVAVHCNSNRENAEKVCADIREMGRKALLIQADLSKMDGIKSIFEKTLSEFEKIDVYVNNAGITKTCPLEDMTEDIFDQLCAVDFKSAYFGVQQAANSMAKLGIKGSIVIISSANAKQQSPNASCYGSFKTALSKFGRHAAIEYAKYGIRVNVIEPGWTDTGEARLPNKEETYYRIPLKRWCTPEEIGHAVLFFCSEWARSITGANLAIDSGICVQSDKPEKYGL